MSKQVISFFVAGILLFPAYISSQPISTARKKFNKGQAFAATGQIEEAKKAYKDALKADKDLLDAYAALGKLAFAEKDWGEVKSQFDKILDRDRNNLEAHYYMAIANREIGKFRPEFANSIPLMNKLLEFQKAEKHFETILASDSLFRDVLYQYALLERYRGKFEKAIWLGERQIQLKPELVDAQVGLFDLYRRYIQGTGREEAIAYLQNLSSAHARFFIAEKLRRDKDFAAADSIFRTLIVEKPELPREALYLAYAKSLFSQNIDTRAEKLYWMAVDGLHDEIGAQLIFEDLKYIISDEELGAYERAKTVEEKREFFRAFWARRDPLPATQTNLRLAEHYRRFVFAEDNYEYTGFRSWVNNADKLRYLEFPRAYHLNTEFNDKGLVYLRHGPPDDKIVTVNPGVPSNESWKYWRSGRNPEMTFHFLYDEHTSGNLWTLTATIPYPQMLEDRITWHPRYQQMLAAQNLADQFRFEEEIIQESKASVEKGFRTDRYRWDKQISPLDVPVTTASFRDADGKTLFEVYYAVPLAELAKHLDEPAAEVIGEKGIALHDAEWKLLGRLTQNVRIPLQQQQVESGKLFIDVFQTVLEPGEYRLGFHFRPRHTNLLSGFNNVQVRMPDFSGTTLSMSDIELAARIEPATGTGMFVKNGLLVLPNPMAAYSREQLVYLYFEIYNLATDANGESQFTIEYIVSKFDKNAGNPFERRRRRDRSSISFKTDRTATGPFSAEYLAIDVSKLKKGDTMLSIRITDRLAKTSTTRERQFVLY